MEREQERRRSSRERRTRGAHPYTGGLLLWLRDAPQHELAFGQGAEAERAVAAYLHEHTAKSDVILLHNRLMPKRRGDIDHIAIAHSGVYVIDAKGWHGKVRIENPLVGSAKLRVNGRDRTSAIDGLDRQVEAVRGVLESVGHADVPVQSTLCLTEADLPLHRTQCMRGHLLLYRKALAKRLNTPDGLDKASIERLARKLHEAFPPA